MMRWRRRPTRPIRISAMSTTRWWRTARYRLRPGVSLNLEQQVNDWAGVFMRAGWADGNVEPWDFTDIDRTVPGGRINYRQELGTA